MGKGSNVQVGFISFLPSCVFCYPRKTSSLPQKAQRARADAAKRKAQQGKGGGGAAGIEKRKNVAAHQCKMCMVKYFLSASHFHSVFLTEYIPGYHKKTAA